MKKATLISKMGHRRFKFGKADVGYNRKGYSWRESIKRYKKTGVFRAVKSGSGHEAGQRWGDEKNIDPDSPQRRYSKNSPSFDEGVKLSKDSRSKKRAALIEQKLLDIAERMQEI